MTFLPVLRARTRGTWRPSRQPVRSLRLQLSSPAVFDEADRGPDTHRSLHHPRRSQVAPSGSGSTNATTIRSSLRTRNPAAAVGRIRPTRDIRRASRDRMDDRVRVCRTRVRSVGQRGLSRAHAHMSARTGRAPRSDVSVPGTAPDPPALSRRRRPRVARGRAARPESLHQVVQVARSIGFTR